MFEIGKNSKIIAKWYKKSCLFQFKDIAFNIKLIQYNWD